MKVSEMNIVELAPMQVIKFYGFSETPEEDATTAANTWLQAQGLLKKNAYRSFGFNNPNPSAGSPNYGYEIWILPNDGIPEGTDAEIKDFVGGLYAVASCENLDSISADWQKLVAWRDTSEYQSANHQWLEEVFNPPTEIADLRFLLYLPISR